MHSNEQNPKTEYTFGGYAGEILLNALKENNPKLLQKFSRIYGRFGKGLNSLKEIKDNESKKMIEMTFYRDNQKSLKELFQNSPQFLSYALNTLNRSHKEFLRNNNV